MKNLLARSTTTLTALACLTAAAQLPPDFPTLTVTTNYPPAVAPGYIFQGVNLPVTGVGYYAMIVTNDGSPIWYQKLTNACWDFKVLPNGYLHYAQQIKALTYTGGGDVVHQILDENYSPVETIQAGNGYIAEAHDFGMLPNGDVLLFGYYLTRVDMSQVVSNGNPAALVSGAILQELDAQRNVVFQWRSWDHYPFTSDWVNSTAAVISEFHFNRVFLDDDGNLVVSTPAWVKKISRQTGDIMWHLGGTENQFTFVGVSQATGISDFASHDITRLPNGDVLLYNNSLAGVPGSSSTAKEYSLDETNKIATRIWSYTPDPAVAGPFQGSAQRLANGNTFVGWGGLPGLTTVACTEVSGTNVVFQMKFDNTNVVSYRSFRFPYPSQTQATVAPVYQVANGNSYEFGLTGVSIDVQGGTGGYNILTVTRSPYAPVYPLFQGKAPLVLPVRVSMTETALATLGATINFDAQSFALDNPTNLTLYYRPTTGQGLFLPQPTSYNPATQKLSATVVLTSQGNDFGEFIFGYPDLADVPYPPMLNEVENYRGVQPYGVIAPRLANGEVTYSANQELPSLLSWSPKGFARSYQFQISTNLDFSTTLVSVAYQTQAYYVWKGAAPNTTYYYRAMTVNEGGQSDWSVGSFTMVPPFITLTFPGGGEVLQRGVPYFIRWKDNLAESVNIELYKNGALVTTLATNVPSNGAYQWQPGLSVVPGSDYAIKISSSTNSTLSYVSDSPFSIIDPPKINAATFATLPGGQVQFALNVPGATQATVLGSTNLSSWQELQTVPLINGSGVFIDGVLTNFSQRFYRLRVP
jgi:hypothetical protein